MHPVFPHLGQEFVDVLRFGDVQRRLDEVRELEFAVFGLAVVQVPDEIADVDDALYVVEAAS